MTTVLDIIRLSLKEAGALGVGQTAQAEDYQDALRILNGMIARWQTERVFVYHLVDHAIPTTGAHSYTIGPGGDIDIASRPNLIQAVYYRMPNEIDIPLTIIRAYEDYARIMAKGLETLPSHAFYDTAFPLGILRVWPSPPSGYELHVVMREQLPTFTKTNDVVHLPGEYEEAIRYGLAVRLRPLFQLDPDPSLTVLAQTAFEALRAANVQIPLMSMPANIPTHPMRYNIFADRFR